MGGTVDDVEVVATTFEVPVAVALAFRYPERDVVTVTVAETAEPKPLTVTFPDE